MKKFLILSSMFLLALFALSAHATQNDRCGNDCDDGGSQFTIVNVQGIQGEKGDKGDKGDTGSRGLRGYTGKTGATGNDGKDGVSIVGLNGVDGRSITGDSGSDGSDGADGADGNDGSDGVDGSNGLNGSNGKDGINGINGADGESYPGGVAGALAAASIEHPNPGGIMFGIGAGTFESGSAFAIGAGKNFDLESNYLDQISFDVKAFVTNDSETGAAASVNFHW